MSDSRKYLIGATATIVAARIAARANPRVIDGAKKPAPELSLKDEFVATYQELEQAFAALGAGDGQKPYGEKRAKRENEHLLED